MNYAQYKNNYNDVIFP